MFINILYEYYILNTFYIISNSIYINTIYFLFTKKKIFNLNNIVV